MTQSWSSMHHQSFRYDAIYSMLFIYSILKNVAWKHFINFRCWNTRKYCRMYNLRSVVIFKHMLRIKFVNTSFEIILMWVLALGVVIKYTGVTSDAKDGTVTTLVFSVGTHPPVNGFQRSVSLVISVHEDHHVEVVVTYSISLNKCSCFIFIICFVLVIA